jgi:putative hydrolase
MNNNHPVADLHIHTIASGHAYSTVKEIVDMAETKGLKLVAITDHGPAMPGGAHLYHFWNLRVFPEKIGNIRILKGAEVNIVGSEGEIDIPKDLLGDLDIVLLALHFNCGYKGKTKEENTHTLIKAMEKHKINVISHAGNPIFPLDYDLLCKKAKENNVAIEFNNSSYTKATSRSGSYKLDLELAVSVKKYRPAVVLGSDAHFALDVGNFEKALSLIEKTGVDKELILNYSAEKVLNFLKDK